LAGTPERHSCDLALVWRVELGAGPEREAISSDGVRCFVSSISGAA
jgi:hypothetical protein